MKIDATIELKSFTGDVIKDGDKGNLTVGLALASILGRDKSDDPLRSYSLGMKFMENKEVELNQSDQEFVKKTVKKTGVWIPMITGQLLGLLEKPSKEDKKDK